jgi:hypothetical protein
LRKRRSWDIIRIFKPMRGSSKILYAALPVMALALAQPASAESIGDFFRKLGNSIAHPHKHPTPRSRSEKGRSPSPSPLPVNAAPVPTQAPEVPIRAASVVTEAKNSKRDLPYGIPVPNKEGFVTSPYAPGEGIVDVRGIPSGTEVKDPYTGKMFLRP